MAITANLNGPGSIDTNAVEQTTNNTYDPLRQFLANQIMGLYGKNQAQIPDFVMQGIQGLIQNPGETANVAGQAFQQVSNPLLQSLQPQFKSEQNTLRDIMRKNGALQSGASAYETSRLLENQGNRAGQLLASNYVPLLNQVNQNVQSGVNAGIKTPAENLGSLAGILNAFGNPTSTYTGRTGAGTTLNNASNSSSPYYSPLAFPQMTPATQPTAPTGWTPGQWSGY